MFSIESSYLLVVFDMAALRDGVHSRLLSGALARLGQELHHCTLRQLLWLPQQLVLILIHYRVGRHGHRQTQQTNNQESCSHGLCNTLNSKHWATIIHTKGLALSQN